MLHSYRVQWMLINARAEQAATKQTAEVEKQLCAATLMVERLREEVTREQALLDHLKYAAYIEEVINTQFSIMPILENSLHKMSKDFSELASAVEETTHRLPTAGIINPSPEELQHELAFAEQALSEIQAIAGPHQDKLSQYAVSMAGLTAILSEELQELEQCKELLTNTIMGESQRRSFLIHYIQEYGRRPDQSADSHLTAVNN